MTTTNTTTAAKLIPNVRDQIALSLTERLALPVMYMTLEEVRTALRRGVRGPMNMYLTDAEGLMMLSRTDKGWFFIGPNDGLEGPFQNFGEARRARR